MGDSFRKSNRGGIRGKFTFLAAVMKYFSAIVTGSNELIAAASFGNFVVVTSSFSHLTKNMLFKFNNAAKFKDRLLQDF